MKTKLFLLIALVAMLSGCEFVPDEETYYLNEDFVLVEREETIEHEDGDTQKYRFWKVMKQDISGDSTLIGEIKSAVTDTDGTCGGSFYITNELWHNKEVGDVLHFEYIRKDRFYKVKNLNAQGYWTATGTVKVDEPIELEVEESSDIGYGTSTESSDLDYAERLRLERRRDELKEELEEIESQLR